MYMVVMKNLKVTNYFQNLIVDGRLILNCFSKN